MIDILGPRFVKAFDGVVMRLELGMGRQTVDGVQG